MDRTDAPGQILTAGEALRQGAAGLVTGESAARGDTPRLDAEVLLGHVLGASRAALLTHPERPLTPAQLAGYRHLVARRAAGEPVAYLTGRREFMGLDFAVDRRVLIPRPETETLVERALLFLRQRQAGQASGVRDLGQAAGAGDGSSVRLVQLGGSPASGVMLSAAKHQGQEAPTVEPPPDPSLALRMTSRLGNPTRSVLVADVGTGSGAIAVSLAHHCPDCRVTATDVSPAALAVARGNAARLLGNAAGRVRFVRTLLLSGVRPRFELITANLPYIPRADLEHLPLSVRRYEPWLALDGGADGLDLYRGLLADVRRVLAPGGALLLECDPRQADALGRLAREALPGATASIHRDLAGLERIVQVAAPGG